MNQWAYSSETEWPRPRAWATLLHTTNATAAKGAPCIPVTPPELLAEAKLGLEIAARDTAINLRKGYSKDLFAKSDARLNKAFTRFQNLVTQNCLREMIPRRETSESYALRQVAQAMKLAGKRAKWFYQQGNTDDPVIQPLDRPKSKKLLDDLNRLSKAWQDNKTDKQSRSTKTQQWNST